MNDIWDKTYKRDVVRELPNITLLTVISEHAGGRQLVARMDIAIGTGDATTADIYVRMTPLQMRALAAALMATAARVEHVLMPQLELTSAEIIHFAPPAGLYHEPEVA